MNSTAAYRKVARLGGSCAVRYFNQQAPPLAVASRWRKQQEERHPSQAPGHRSLVQNAATFQRNMEEIRSMLVEFGGGKVEVTRDEKQGFATIYLNHVDKSNAMSGKMMVELANIVNELREWKEGKGVILSGLGGHFCSGADLELVKGLQRDPHKASLMSLFMQKTMWQLHSLNMISVALVQGKALGGGAELCLACDFRLMTEDSEVAFIQCKMGVSTGWGGGTRLVNLVGPSTALHLLMTGRHLSPNEAIDLGLANLVIKEGEEPVETAHEWLKLHTAHLEPDVLHTLKQMVVNVADSPSGEESMNKERDLFFALWGGAAQSKALTKKRKFYS